MSPTLGEPFQVIRFDPGGMAARRCPPSLSIADLGGDAVLRCLTASASPRLLLRVSIGGMIGMWLAINAPERLDRLALACTSAHLPQARLAGARGAMVRADGMEAIGMRRSSAGSPRHFSIEVRTLWSGCVERCSPHLPRDAACCEAMPHLTCAPSCARSGAYLGDAAEDAPATPPHMAA